MQELENTLQANDVGRRALDHRDVCAMLEQVGADIVSGVVRADHDNLAACVTLSARMRSRMMLLSCKLAGAGKGRDVRLARVSRCHHEVRWPYDGFAVISRDTHVPFAGGLVVGRTNAVR